MTLDLRYEVRAGQGCPVDPSAQRVDNIAKGFIAGNGVVGVFNPKLDRTRYLQFVSGEADSIEDDLGWCRHSDELPGELILKVFS